MNIYLLKTSSKFMRSDIELSEHKILDEPMINFFKINFKNSNINFLESTIDISKGFDFSKLIISLNSYVGNVNEKDGYAVFTVDALPSLNNDIINDIIVKIEKSNLDYYASKSVIVIKNSKINEVSNLSNLEYDDHYDETLLVINTLKKLSIVENNIKNDIIYYHLNNNVQISNIQSVTIGPSVTIGENTHIFPNSYITGKVSIGKSCNLGPFIRIRSSASIADNVSIGNFVELKNVSILEGSKAAHLSYLGDAEIGHNVNIGCGVITNNYDGKTKHKTIIEDNAFVGCNSNLVAPVTIGENSLIAAGSTITKDVKAFDMGIARSKQINKEGFSKKYFKK